MPTAEKEDQNHRKAFLMATITDVIEDLASDQLICGLSAYSCNEKQSPGDV